MTTANNGDPCSSCACDITYHFIRLPRYYVIKQIILICIGCIMECIYGDPCSSCACNITYQFIRLPRYCVIKQIILICICCIMECIYGVIVDCMYIVQVVAQHCLGQFFLSSPGLRYSCVLLVVT